MLEQAISILLTKGLSGRYQRQSHLSFYSWYILLPQKGGGVCPIPDLRVLDSYLKKLTFRMFKFNTVSLYLSRRHLSRSAGCFFSHKHPASRFSFQGTAYEYFAVPFVQEVPLSAGVDVVHHLISTSRPNEDERLPALGCLPNVCVCNSITLDRPLAHTRTAN